MITNDKELAVVRSQLALAEHALESLRKEVKNPRNFAVYSEGAVDQIAELKTEIEAYEKAKKNNRANGKSSKRRPRKAS